jgi:hypothetical protein
MRSAKRKLPIVLLGLAVLCSTAVYAADDDNQAKTYSGRVGAYNPCDNSLVLAPGTNYVTVHENARDHDNAHVFVEMKFVGSGKDAQGHPYQTELKAKGQFGAEAPFYDLPFREKWEGNGAPDFFMDGTVRVFVQNGVAQNDAITQFNTTCSNGNSDGKDSDGDHDRSH